MPKLLNFRFPEGVYFLNCNNTELKRSSKIIRILCFRTASLGGSGLKKRREKSLFSPASFWEKGLLVSLVVVNQNFTVSQNHQIKNFQRA